MGIPTATKHRPGYATILETPMTLNESTVEYAALEWFEQLDYAIGHGTDFAPCEPDRAFHKMLRDGVPVEFPRPDDSIAGDLVQLVDFSNVQTSGELSVAARNPSRR